MLDRCSINKSYELNTLKRQRRKHSANILKQLLKNMLSSRHYNAIWSYTSWY